MKTLSRLFAGSPAKAKLIDDSQVEIFVRAIPQRFLARVLECAEFPTALIELCTYTRSERVVAADEKIAEDGQRQAREDAQNNAAYPDIPPPTGYDPVPLGWT